MAKLKVKKGDNVVVISGKDKGKTGKILQVIPAENRALVEGVNIITKHQKPKSQKEKGGIIKKPSPIKIDNIMVVCPACGKATRVGKKMVGEHLSRFCKKCGAVLDKAFVKAVKKTTKKKDTATAKANEEKSSNNKQKNKKS